MISATFIKRLIETSIIILHGLSARSSETFIAYKVDGDSDSGDVNWLTNSDMLPAVMPYARILTYDWNADYDKHASSDIFFGHAQTLLDRLHVNRKRAVNNPPPQRKLLGDWRVTTSEANT